MRPTPSGRQPHSRAVVGASFSTGAMGMRLRAHQRAFRSPLWKPSGTEAGETPMERSLPNRSPFFILYPRENFSFCQHFPSAERITAFLQENPPFPAAYAAFRFSLA